MGIVLSWSYTLSGQVAVWFVFLLTFPSCIYFSYSFGTFKMASAIESKPSVSKLELRTAYGPVFRDVLNVPPRDCTPEEIPIIDLAPLYSDNVEDRKALAGRIRKTAVNTGFFYIKNHGILDEIIENAKNQLLT